MRTFSDKKRFVWLAGIAVLILGFIAAALILPSTASLPGNEGPDVRVPKMQNVPPRDEKMKLDVEGDEQRR